jgi:hypothetical protein
MRKNPCRLRITGRKSRSQGRNSRVEPRSRVATQRSPPARPAPARGMGARNILPMRVRETQLLVNVA